MGSGRSESIRVTTIDEIETDEVEKRATLLGILNDNRSMLIQAVSRAQPMIAQSSLHISTLEKSDKRVKVL